MALKKLDATGNESFDRTLAKINAMFAELYAASSTTPDPSVTTLTASGAIAGDTLTAATDLSLGTGTKTASATAGAATLNKPSGVITSEALTTAAGASYVLTITNSAIAATDQVFASVQYGSATAGTPVVTKVAPGAGSLVITVQNVHASAAFDGTIKVSFAALKA